jgi:hypothetical protein
LLRASSIGWLIAGAFGCASGDVDLFLGFPHLEGARSVVLAVPENGELTLYGASLDGSRIRVRFDYDGEGTIEALLFDETLEELRLSEGALERPIPGEDEGQLGALDPIGSYAARVDGEAQVAEWIEDPASSARDARYRKARSICATFSAPRPLGTLVGSLAFAARIDDEHALLGSRDGELVIASRDGLRTIPLPFGSYVRSAFSDGDRIHLSEWFSPAMYRGVPSPSEGVVDLERLPDSPLVSGASALAGGGGRIIAAGEEGEAAWFDGASWRSLPAFAVNDSLVRAAWTPEESFYWARASGALGRVDAEGDVRGENLDVGVYSIAPIAELGTILGTADGNFLRRAPEGWGGLGGDYGWWVLDLEAYAGGFFFLLASGSIGQYRVDPDDPLCPDQSVLGYVNDGRIVRLGRSLLAAGWDGSLPTEVVIVDF